MWYSYERISTKNQDFLRQDEAIEKYCLEHSITLDETFSDIYTGKKFDRPNYIEMKEKAVKGDYIVIKELDRLGRNWDMIKNEWKYFMDNDISVIVVDMPLLSESIYDPNGNVDLTKKLIKNIVLETMCYNAQIETERVSKRTSEALQALKKKGVKLGRPVNKIKEEQIKELLDQGYNKSDVAFLTNSSRITVNNVIKRLQTDK